MNIGYQGIEGSNSEEASKIFTKISQGSCQLLSCAEELAITNLKTIYIFYLYFLLIFFIDFSFLYVII